MSDLRLSVATMANPLYDAIHNGAVKPEGIELTTTRLFASELFWRQLQFGEFDVSEMSLASLLIAFSRGDRGWLPIPVFATRSFNHTLIWVRSDAGITRPEDLKGKRVGVPEYQQTAAVWSRGVLQHEYGVFPRDIEWFMERTQERSQGGNTAFQVPADVTLHRIPERDSIGGLLRSGDLDATLIYYNDNNLVDRSRVRLEPPEFRLLFGEPEAEGCRYLAETGMQHINHCVVVRRSLVERDPWVVLNLFNAFRQAKERWLRGVWDSVRIHMQLGVLPLAAAQPLKQDPAPYGISANRKTLETLCSYLCEQGLTPSKIRLDDIFPANTLDL